MPYLLGTAALSAFRTQQLHDALRPAMPALTALRSQWIYHAVPAPTADPTATLAALRILLGALLIPEADVATLPTATVMPRVGTVSPWSSKALDIAHRCGIALEQFTRGRLYFLESATEATATAPVAALLHDPMTESLFWGLPPEAALTPAIAPRPLVFTETDEATLAACNRDWGLGLSPAELAYLAAGYAPLGRLATDAELMMFAQANSEHCRHKIFNSTWEIDGLPQGDTLFGMIKHTFAQHPAGVLSAYRDNGAVLVGHETVRLWPHGDDGQYRYHREAAHLVIKVETHNHPTAISPFAGAATGAGGEIRDGAATGLGAKPKAGVVGFCTSHLRLGDALQPWEIDGVGQPPHLASPAQIMRDGPLGAAAFNNEFGRPTLAGFFRTLERATDGHPSVYRGFHKPVMVAGGVSQLRPGHDQKQPIPPQSPILVLGGPALLIGLGGGAASSHSSGTQSQAQDFASVQRDNPEMERRAQEVIDACWALGDANPILSIHDVGAGGLANAIPELLHGGGAGGRIDLRAIPCGDPQLSPMELWCNEAQERYVLALHADGLAGFLDRCRQERCPVAVVGWSDASGQLVVHDSLHDNRPVALPLDWLLGKLPAPHRVTQSRPAKTRPFDATTLDLAASLERVLQFPAVADKQFLITIGDRTVGGMTARDPLVGPRQVAVADCGATFNSFCGFTGDAMALGERSPVALLDAAASARLAVGEALTNLLAAHVAALGDVKLSANWMAAANWPGEDAALFEAVRAVGLELAPALGIGIPVGKDSLSMQTRWATAAGDRQVVSPLTLVATAFVPLADARRVLTPLLVVDADAPLLLIDLGRGQHRLGGSVLAQVYCQLGDMPPDVDDPALLIALQRFLHGARDHLLAYHDRSDGGLLVALLEMAFAAHCGLDLQVRALTGGRRDALMPALFAEELGVVVQVRPSSVVAVQQLLSQHHLQDCAHWLGAPAAHDRVEIRHGDQRVYGAPLGMLRRLWSTVSHQMASQRDNPTEAAAEFDALGRVKLTATLATTTKTALVTPMIAVGARPRVGVLREQGINGHHEMAAAWLAAGFDAVDLPMTALLDHRRSLDDLVGLAACGGFSYGDVLGAGQGWAKSILFDPRLRDSLYRFFHDPRRFALGICNGCQMLTALRSLLPGTAHWPTFGRNRSEQFEARWVTVEILDSPSIFFRDLVGSRLPIVVSHGEGRAMFATADDARQVLDRGLVPMRFVDEHGAPAHDYPFNPNGSPEGITALTNEDGRIAVLMPHPERCFRLNQFSWIPSALERPIAATAATEGGLSDPSPWHLLFRGARRWVD